MDSQTYWRNRETEQRKHDIKDEQEYRKHIEEIYQNMIDEIEKEINGFYGKYARKEGITMAEAKKRAAKLDIEAYGRKAAKYVKEKNFFKQAKKAGFKYKYDKQAENSSKPSALLRETGAGYRTRLLCDLVSQRGLVCNQRGSRVRPSRAAGLPFLHCANARAIACRLSLRPLRAG